MDRNVELWRAFPSLLVAGSVPTTPCGATRSAPRECADFVASLEKYTRSTEDGQRTRCVDVTIWERVFRGLLQDEAHLLRLFLSNIDGLLQDV